MELIMRKILFIVLILFLLFHHSNFAQIYVNSCHLPVPPQGCVYDTTLSKTLNGEILYKNGSVHQNCISFKRLLPVAGKQRAELTFADGTKEIRFIDELDALVYSNLGPGCQSLIFPIYPAREFYIDFVKRSTVKRGYLEISPFLCYDLYYHGEDFDRMLYGVEILIAPFDYLLGDHLSFAVGTSPFFEKMRTRVPIKAELRINFFGKGQTDVIYDYYPHPCKIRDPRNANDVLSNETLSNLLKNCEPEPIKEAAYTNVDSSVVFYPQCTRPNKRWNEPYFFLESGIIIDLKFDGSGKSPSVNPEDYGEYLIGAGLGTVLWNILDIKFGYKYLRLNVRTRCSQCEKYYVNSDDVHSVFFQLGINFNIW